MKPLDFTSNASKRDPGATLELAIQSGPVVYARLPALGRVWLLTQHDAITDLLKSPHRFSADAQKAGRRNPDGLFWAPVALRAWNDNMQVKDAPQHTRLRAIIDKALSQRRAESLRPTLAQIADTLLDRMEETGETDLVEGFARPFSLMVICELLGLSDEIRPKFLKWGRRFTTAPGLADKLLFPNARRKIVRTLKSEFEHCKSNPREGLLSAFAQAPDTQDQLTGHERIAACFLMLSAGHETVMHLVSAGAFTLLQNPQQLERLKRDWSLSPGCVDEIIRYCAPVQMTKPRFVINDLEFHGARMKRGERVLGFLAAAGRDPAIHAAPDTFDISRKTTRASGFGMGAHACPSASLARAQIEIALERVFSRWPNMQIGSAPEWNNRPDLRGPRRFLIRTTA